MMLIMSKIRRFKNGITEICQRGSSLILMLLVTIRIDGKILLILGIILAINCGIPIIGVSLRVIQILLCSRKL